MALAEQPPHVDTSSHTPANATDLKPQGAQMNGVYSNGDVPQPKMTIQSNWTTFDEPSLSRESLTELFANNIPAVRHKKLLTPEECAKMAEITKSFKLGTYNPKVIFPPIGTVGISQFDYPGEKDRYLSERAEAMTLQHAFIREVNVDIVGRVMDALREATRLPVRMAKEEDREYFAGLLRVMDNAVQCHADFAPHVCPSPLVPSPILEFLILVHNNWILSMDHVITLDCAGWEIGSVTSQITWNILLATVPGGETIVYDRPWDGAIDDSRFRKPPPSYAYSPLVLQGRVFKVLKQVEGDVTFFNSRNFHEVKPCDRTVDGPEVILRLTMSSFVGLLERDGGRELILWS